jgi:hypothetical protein
VWATIVEGFFEVVNQTSERREFAAMTFLLAVLRFFLGLLPWKHVAGGVVAVIERAIYCLAQADRRRMRPALPHQWTSMDYVLTGSHRVWAAGRRGAFERANHPLLYAIWIARRLAGLPEACPAVVARVCLANRRPRRA